MSSIERLPPEIMRQIFSIADEPVTTSLVCKQWFKDTRDFLGMLRLADYRQITLLIPQINIIDDEIQTARDLKISDTEIDTLDSARTKKVFQQVIKRVKIISEETKVLEKSKAIGSQTSAARLKFLAEWTQEMEAKNFISFIFCLINSNPDISSAFSTSFGRSIDTFVLDTPECYLSKANEIRRWMAGISNILGKVEEVTLGKMKFTMTHLPEEIGHLSNLKSLHIYRLEMRIQDCSLIPSVEQIKINYQENFNSLERLLEDIKPLSNLKSLHIDYCNLNTFPASILALSQLEYLSLSNNKLTTIPEGISQLTNLKKLCLYKNEIASVPESMRNLKNLEFLALENNQLQDFPVKVLSAPNLLAVALKGNPFSSFPRIEEISKSTLNKNPFFGLRTVVLDLPNSTLKDDFKNEYGKIRIDTGYFKDFTLPRILAQKVLCWRNPKENEPTSCSNVKRMTSSFLLLASAICGVSQTALVPVGLASKAISHFFPNKTTRKVENRCLSAFLPTLAESLVVGYAFIQNFYKDAISIEEIEQNVSQVPWIKSQLESYFVLQE
jgi:Leucine-rich repeat (LRR) protein